MASISFSLLILVPEFWTCLESESDMVFSRFGFDASEHFRTCAFEVLRIVEVFVVEALQAVTNHFRAVVT
jgi:hypothetical protein